MNLVYNEPRLPLHLSSHSRVSPPAAVSRFARTALSIKADSLFPFCLFAGCLKAFCDSDSRLSSHSGHINTQGCRAFAAGGEVRVSQTLWHGGAFREGRCLCSKQPGTFSLPGAGFLPTRVSFSHSHRGAVSSALPSQRRVRPPICLWLLRAVLSRLLCAWPQQ